MRTCYLAMAAALGCFLGGAGPAQAVVAAGGPAKAGEAAPNLGFEVQVKMSKRAAQTLRRKKEGVLVSASYYGDPTAAAQRHANEVGQIDLGQEMVPLPGIEGKVRVTGKTVERQRLAWIDGPPKVNVNVFTARRSGPDNLIACDFIDGPVASVATGVTTVSCGLITENPRTVAFPRQ